MKVGDYIRDKRGMIAKIKNFWIYHNVTFIITDKDTISESMVVKSSPNIIDLIEVGDYVNGYLIEDKTIFGNLGLTHWVLKTPTGYLNERNIYTIVTKEQFENCMYKIGE